MPAAVYLLDLHKPGEDVRNYLGLVAPVLSSRENIKVGLQWVHSTVCVLLLLLFFCCCGCCGLGGRRARAGDGRVWVLCCTCRAACSGMPLTSQPCTVRACLHACQLSPAHGVSCLAPPPACRSVTAASSGVGCCTRCLGSGWTTIMTHSRHTTSSRWARLVPLHTCSCLPPFSLRQIAGCWPAASYLGATPYACSCFVG